MGVHGLWDLVSPAGQRVNFSALENKVVAVDASIWLYHFVKAMRDEHGNMVKGAHLLGFFRRICKLLYLKIRPVFVFDGPAPELKRRILRLRAQSRDAEERQRRKAVEKLLRNQLQMHILQATADMAAAGGNEEESRAREEARDSQEELDEAMQAARSEDEEGFAGEGDAQVEASQVEELPPDPAPVRRHREHVARGFVPQPFRGFMSRRRGVGEVTLPDLPEEPLRDILMVPDRRGRNSRMREPDEWKGYILPDGNVVTVPLDGPVALEEFEQLPAKMKYTLLQRAKEAWYGETRLKAVEAKDDMNAFVNVQLETFLRHIRTNKELEKVKKTMAEEVSQPAGSSGIAVGDVYQPPSWLRAGEEPDLAGFALDAPAEQGKGGRKGRGRGRRRGISQLEGAEPTRLEGIVADVELEQEEGPTVDEEPPSDDVETGRPVSGSAAELFGAAFLGHGPASTDQVPRNAEQQQVSVDEEEEDEFADMEWCGLNQVIPEEKPSQPDVTSACEPVLAISDEELVGEVGTKDGVSSSGKEDALPDSQSLRRLGHRSIGIRMHQPSPTSMPPHDTETVAEATPGAASSGGREPRPRARWAKGTVRAQAKPRPGLRRLVQLLRRNMNSRHAAVPAAPPRVPAARGRGAHQRAADSETTTRHFNKFLAARRLRSRGRGGPARGPQRSTRRGGAADADASAGGSGLWLEASGGGTAVPPPEASGSVLSSTNAARSTADSAPVVVSASAASASASSSNVDSVGAGFCPPVQAGGVAGPAVPAPWSGVDNSSEAKDRAAELEAVAAAAKAAPQAVPSVPAASGSDDSLDRVWCVTHFQYRWRCKHLGVEHECAAVGTEVAAAGGSASSSSGGKGGKGGKGRGRGGRGSASLGADGLGHDRGEQWNLDDEEMEDLEFQRMEAELQDERQELLTEMHRAKRNMDTVTKEMQTDVEALLESFGIPYVHSPAEAEAQCAFLADARLVDAVASDDSDTLVFGAREVYRRLFAEDHMVECYTLSRLQAKLGLTQGDLVMLAMLLGCDYTIGVHGIGIVNGLEVVRAFTPRQEEANWLESMRQFRAWAQNVADWGTETAGIQEDDARSVATFKRSHRNFRTQWNFPEDFPDPAVHSAFMQAVVDRSQEPFSWAPVNVPQVLARVTEASGLEEGKLRERLEPALARYTDGMRQPRISEYMVPADASSVALVRSARMQQALRGLRGEESPERSPTPPRARGRGRGARAKGRAGGAAGEGQAGGRPAKRRKAAAKAPGWNLRTENTRIDLDLSD